MLEIPLLPDIVRWVISDYLQYDDICELGIHIMHLQCSPVRIQEYIVPHKDVYIVHTQYTSHGVCTGAGDFYSVRVVSTHIDHVLRRVQYHYENICIREINYGAHNVDAVERGLERTWYADGTLCNEQHWHNDVLHGISKYWDTDGTLTYTLRYDNGVPVNI